MIILRVLVYLHNINYEQKIMLHCWNTVHVTDTEESAKNCVAVIL
jgi:hypothetical protein